MFRAQMMRVITGAIIRTAATGKRWELSSVRANMIRGFSGLAQEYDSGYLAIDGTSDVTGHASASAILASPALGTTLTRALVECFTDLTAGVSSSKIELQADKVQVDGPLYASNGAMLNTHWSYVPAMIAGPAPSIGTPKVEYEGSTVVNTNASGDYTCPIPAMNGVVTVVASVGDLVGAFTLTRTYALNSFSGRAYNPGGGVLASSPFRVNWIARGW